MKNVEQNKLPPPATHHAWIKFVLTQTLEYDESLLAEGQAIPQTLRCEMDQHGVLLKPDIVLNDPATKKPRLLIQTYPRSQDLNNYVAGSRWKASPDTRMTELLHATGVRLGLVTNGDHWMLVDAPKGETTGYASWYASLWREEKITLRAFRSLLSMSRFFGVADEETIEALLEKSASNQQEVTDQLGLQVRKAVEVLIQSLDKADQDHERELLEGVEETVLYESALTVMMRLVFLFCAEERELIPTKPFPVYEQNYSVSTIAQQLREIADQQGEELLERRYDAWPRLLTAFRIVFGGIRHDDIHVPAYGGRLFDPDRFPFLEGRKAGTTWRVASDGWRGNQQDSPTTHHPPPTTLCKSNPLPVNNRTVLHLLEALQLLQIKVPGRGPAEARRLSFRALDIEQIGHVYEGLLDHTAKRAGEPFLGLIGSKKKEPELPLSELERVAGDGWWVEGEEANPSKELLEFLKKETGRTVKALKKALITPATHHDPLATQKFRTACQSEELWQRVEPYAGLIRNDSFGYPVVITKGSIFVTAGTDRRSSGTHYTPRSLTEPIVQYTLEPLVYVGPAEGKEKSDWKLKSAAELLDLKICDMACGSGAFLVQAARYMSERLLEAWDEAERVVGDGWRVAGKEKKNPTTHHAPPTTQNKDSNMESDDASKTLSGTGCLATGDGVGDGMLSGDESISEGRDVRDDEPDSSGSSIDTSEHRRGSGEATHEGISELPKHSTGITDGSGNTSASLPASQSTDTGETGTTSTDDRQNQPNADRTKKIPQTQVRVTGEEWRVAGKSSPPTTRHPPPTTLITPEGKPATGALSEQIIPADPDERKTYAMRIIAQRCLYGVDINPLAVEMAKLSLWLLTLAKDMPFEFLDHAIRCGDSLVGLHDLEQLKHYSLKPDFPNEIQYGGVLENEVPEAINLRLKLESMPANTVEDIKAQEKLLAEAEEKIARLKCAADLLVSAEFWGENTKDKLEKVRHAAVVTTHYIENGPTEEFEEKANKERRGQRMFHWPLEFPEVVVERGGFDAFVGNPPFSGGQRITGIFGTEYRNFLIEIIAQGQRGSSDLCAYFFLRCYAVMRQPSLFGLLATNTIAQGDTREVGLGQLTEIGAVIIHAIPSKRWPGVASLEVAHVWLTKGKWVGKLVLNESEVELISPFLTSSTDLLDEPHSLFANADICFQGCNILGDGFFLDESDFNRLVQAEDEKGTVVLPCFNGEQINSSPSLNPTRWIINFFDWPLDRSMAPQDWTGAVAADFPQCLNIIRHKVKPARDKVTYSKRAKENWWQYERNRPELYSSITGLDRVLVIAATSQTLAFAFTSTEVVWTHALYVITLHEYQWFAILQSSVHEAWARYYGSSMKGDLRYTPTSTLEPFPFCNSNNDLERVGQVFYQSRSETMLDRQEGLTKIYNRFHKPNEISEDIQKLRVLHVEMDQAVAAAYGWDDLDLDHGFHETKQGIRYTISEPARREVLQRLLKLNHERYAEEVAQGLHDKKKKKAKKKTTAKKKTKKKPINQGPSLFDKEGDKA